MGLDPDVSQGLASEHISDPVDLAEFKQEYIEMIASNLCKPKGNRMAHPDQAQSGQRKTVPNPGLRFGVKQYESAIKRNCDMKAFLNS